MYNLLVSSVFPSLAEDDPLEIERTRFLEYTNGTIAVQLSTLSSEAIAAIASWPTLVMAEGRGNERAFVARIMHVTAGASSIDVTIQRLQVIRPLLNDDLWKARGLLDIQQFEFSRHHWAVKDRDLLEVLGNDGITGASLSYVGRPGAA